MVYEGDDNKELVHFVEKMSHSIIKACANVYKYFSQQVFVRTYQ